MDMDSNFEPIKLTELKPDPIIEDSVEELGLVSPKFIRILNPPAATIKLLNLTKKLLMLMATRRPLILSEAPEAHGGDDPPGELAPEARR